MKRQFLLLEQPHSYWAPPRQTLTLWTARLFFSERIFRQDSREYKIFVVLVDIYRIAAGQRDSFSWFSSPFLPVPEWHRRRLPRSQVWALGDDDPGQGEHGHAPPRPPHVSSSSSLGAGGGRRGEGGAGVGREAQQQVGGPACSRGTCCPQGACSSHGRRGQLEGAPADVVLGRAGVVGLDGGGGGRVELSFW